MTKASIAVIGCGYWGKNLIRNMAELGALAAVVDSNEGAARAMAETHKVPARDFESVIADPAIEGVVIASSAATHSPLAAKALSAGKHVFVEKPLALNVKDAEGLMKLAQEKKRVLMVGHLLHYHPAFQELLKEVQKGRVGKLCYIQSNRMSYGKVRTEEDVLWSFAPHDLSMITAIVGKAPTKVSAHGSAHVSKAICDIVNVHLSFEGGVDAHVIASWLSPIKEHKLTVIGDKGALVFDDTLPWESKLTFYANMVKQKNGAPVAEKGEATALALTPSEPLKAECQHFLDAIAGKTAVRTDAKEGLRVLEILTLAQKALKEGEGGAMKEYKTDGGSYLVHASACVDDGCEIGAGSKIWHFSHILSGTRMGKNVIVGQNVMIGPQVIVGDRCKIQNNVSLYKGVVLEEGVFCGPSCVFTNVNTPRADIERKDEFLETPVGRGATIGANATIICGHALGAYCLIGAGAVVTKNVKAHALVVGNPAQQIGWVSHAGERLGKDLICPREGRRYRETKDGELEEITKGKSHEKNYAA